MNLLQLCLAFCTTLNCRCSTCILKEIESTFRGRQEPRVCFRSGSSLFIVVFVLACLTPARVSAQKVNDPRWRTYQQDDGLASNDIWSILTNDEIIWFGSSHGLSRFDGIWSHVIVNHAGLDAADLYPATEAESETLPGRQGSFHQPLYTISGEVTALARSDNSESIWIGTRTGQLSLYYPATHTWQSIAQLAHEITRLLVTDSTLWIGTLDGLYWVDIPRIREGVEETDGSFRLSDVSIEFQQELKAQLGAVFELYTHDGYIYAGSQKGLFRYSPDSSWINLTIPTRAQFENLPESWCNDSASEATALRLVDKSPYPSVHAIWIDDQASLWIGTGYGAAKRIAQSHSPHNCWTFFPTYTAEGHFALVQKLTGNQSGGIWAVTDGGGALLFDEYGAVTLPFSRAVPGNLNTNFVRDVAIDRDGAVWFATPIGIFQYLEQTWYLEPNYAETVGLTIGDPDIHNIRDLLVDDTERLWIATGAGIRVKDSRTVEQTRYSVETGDLPSNNLLTMIQDSEGGIWVGTDGAGLSRYHKGRWSTPVVTEALPSATVTALSADENSHIWIGTDPGLMLYDLQSGKTKIIDPLKDQTIESMSFDSAERLWIATSQRPQSGGQNALIWQITLDESGLHYHSQSVQDIAGVRVLPYEFELSLAADHRSPGSMWLAIDQIGLFHWDGTEWMNGDPEGNLPTDFLWTLYTSPHSDDLWIGSEAGVSRFDGRTWGAFTDADGLRSPAIWSITGTRQGGYWFGGNMGLSYYRPDSTAPWVSVDQITGESPALGAEGALIASEGDNFTLSVSAGDLQSPLEKLRIFFRRVPHFRDGESDLANVAWREYTEPLNLAMTAAGTERLDFQARDQAFNYSDVYSVPLIVKPAYVIDLNWLGLGEVERRTFYTLIALGLLAITGFGYVSLEIVQGRRRAVEAMVRSYNPYVSGEPIRRDDMFFGRHNLLQRIIDTLHNNSIMIHGERRIGKTTMLYQIASRLEEVEDPDYWFVPVYIDLEGTQQEMFFHFLIEEIVNQVLLQDDGRIASEIDVDHLLFHEMVDADYSDREFNRDLRRIVRQLQSYGEETRAGRHLRMILLMDEMDVMSSYDHLIQQQLRRIFMRDFAATLGAVVAGIQISKDWERIESPWYNMFNEIEIEPFSDEQAVELLVEPVKDYYAYETDALRFIIEHSNGRPFRIQQYGLEVVTSMLAAGRRRITLEDVMIAHQNIQNSYTHTHSDAGLAPPFVRMRVSGGVH